MKYSKFLAICASLSLCICAAAQNEEEEERPFIKDCDIRLTIGGSPTVAADYFTDGSVFRGYSDIYYYDDEAMSRLYKDYIGPVKTSGAITASFNYRFCNLLSTGLNLAVTSIWTDHYNGVTDLITYRETGAAVYLLPYIRVNYINHKSFRMYMSTALGAGKYLGFEKLKGWRRDSDGKRYFEDESFKFEAQFTLLGMEIGKGPWFGCLEFGVGTLYNGASIGAGYRF